jgi:hypothetical protein
VSQAYTWDRQGWTIRVMRDGDRWRWEVYRMDHGAAVGYAFGKGGAYKAAKYAIGDFRQGLR